MSETPNLPRPKSYTEAHNEFLRAIGDPRTLNKYMATALVVMAVCLVGLIGLNFKTASHEQERVVVRIDDLGRAQALGVSSLNYTIHPSEAKFFLAAFVADYYSRNRQTIEKDMGRAIHFLGEPLALAVMQDEREHKTISKFPLSNDDEITVVVDNIVLGDLSRAPYSAEVDIDKVFKDRAGHETKRETFVVSLTFTTTDKINNAEILINPLGFTILSLRDSQAFETTKGTR